MQKFNLGSSAEKEFLLQNLRPLLLALGDHRNLTINIVKRLSYLTQLFPAMFNEKLCDQLLEIVKKMLQASIAANKNQNFLKVAKSGDTEVKIATIIEIFHQIPAATAKFTQSLISLVLAAEKELMIEPSSPFRGPLVKFLVRYPEETIEIFMNEVNIKNTQYNRFLIYLLRHKDNAVFKNILKKKDARIVELILKEKSAHSTILSEYTIEDENEAQHQAVLIVSTLVADIASDKWILQQTKIMNALSEIWTKDLGKVEKKENITCDLWHLIGHILLKYFEENPSNVQLLYELLKAFCYRFIPDFQVTKKFLI
jgi:transformation/transcription domain-associated protein